MRFLVSTFMVLFTSIVVILLSAGVGGAREWKDVSGKHTTEAEFQNMEKNDVVLQKPDGSTVKIPLNRLSKIDQECARELAGVKNRAVLAAGIKAVFEKGQAETKAKALLLEADAASQLAERFSGKRLTLRFPIENVYPGEKSGTYKLQLGKPDFPVEMQYSYFDEFTLPLSKRSVLAVNKQSLLVVTGSVRFGYPDYEKGRQSVLNFSSPSTNRGLYIYLEGVTNRFCNPGDEEAVIAPVKTLKPTAQDELGPTEKKLPNVAVGDGRPADPKMSYTTEMLADGGTLVTIYNTPFGTIKTAVSLDRVNNSHASHGFLIQAKQGNPFVSVEYENGKITGVKWNDQAVRSEVEEKVVPQGKQLATPPDRRVENKEGPKIITGDADDGAAAKQLDERSIAAMKNEIREMMQSDDGKPNSVTFIRWRYLGVSKGPFLITDDSMRDGCHLVLVAFRAKNQSGVMERMEYAVLFRYNKNTPSELGEVKGAILWPPPDVADKKQERPRAGTPESDFGIGPDEVPKGDKKKTRSASEEWEDLSYENLGLGNRPGSKPVVPKAPTKPDKK